MEPIDFTEKRLERLIEEETDADNKANLQALLDLYNNHEMAVGWSDGGPVVKPLTEKAAEWLRAQ